MQSVLELLDDAWLIFVLDGLQIQQAILIAKSDRVGWKRLSRKLKISKHITHKIARLHTLLIFLTYILQMSTRANTWRFFIILELKYQSPHM